MMSCASQSYRIFYYNARQFLLKVCTQKKITRQVALKEKVFYPGHESELRKSLTDGTDKVHEG